MYTLLISVKFCLLPDHTTTLDNLATFVLNKTVSTSPRHLCHTR